MAIIAKNEMVAVNVETFEVNTYSFSQCPRVNSDGAGFTCAYAPRTKGQDINLVQESVFLGTVNADVVLQAFCDGCTKDGDEFITGDLILNKIDPLIDGAGVNGQTGRSGSIAMRKRLWKLQFPEDSPKAYDIRLEYAVDAVIEDGTVPVWRDMTGRRDDIAYIEKGLCRWVHIRFLDITERVDVPVIGSFAVEFYPVGTV